jgi:hypothetical protein
MGQIQTANLYVLLNSFKGQFIAIIVSRLYLYKFWIWAWKLRHDSDGSVTYLFGDILYDIIVSTENFKSDYKISELDHPDIYYHTVWNLNGNDNVVVFWDNEETS